MPATRPLGPRTQKLGGIKWPGSKAVGHGAWLAFLICPSQAIGPGTLGHYMSELAKFRFQLEQVQERLRQRPDDKALLGLEHRLRKLIDLSNQLGGPPKPVASPGTANKDDGAGPSPSQLTPGMRCEARFEGNQWFEAVIQGMDESGPAYTVTFTGTTEALRCSPADIRPFRPGQTRKRPMGPAPSAQDNKRMGVHKAAAALGGSSRRTRHTREEHVQKKEAEHREKQEAWRQFSQKYGITKKPL